MTYTKTILATLSAVFALEVLSISTASSEVLEYSDRLESSIAFAGGAEYWDGLDEEDRKSFKAIHWCKYLMSDRNLENIRSLQIPAIGFSREKAEGIVYDFFGTEAKNMLNTYNDTYVALWLLQEGC